MLRVILNMNTNLKKGSQMTNFIVYDLETYKKETLFRIEILFIS